MEVLAKAVVEEIVKLIDENCITFWNISEPKWNAEEKIATDGKWAEDCEDSMTNWGVPYQILCAQR